MARTPLRMKVQSMARAILRMKAQNMARAILGMKAQSMARTILRVRVQGEGAAAAAPSPCLHKINLPPSRAREGGSGGG